MYTNDFMGEKLSALGFGTMRLPLLSSGEIDIPQTEAMVDYALRHGINYFDTAWPYHAGKSEIVIGNALKQYPRGSFYLADKYPGHVKTSVYDPGDTFEKQLKKCSVDYYDFYMLHNVYEGSMDVYTSLKWGIMNYFRKQKEEGRIRHLGISTHANADFLRKILDTMPEIEFVQIQLNYVDWKLQDAEEKVRILREYGKPIWVMEPLRGGKLSPMDACSMSGTELAFRWLQGMDDIKVILSGMSNLEQMKQNIGFFEEKKPLPPKTNEYLAGIAEKWSMMIPCTGCRYCCDGCPKGLAIPDLIRSQNDVTFKQDITPLMWIEDLPEEKKPSACIGCGKCSAICPQKIDVPQVMRKLNEQIKATPSWAEISRKRCEDSKRIDEDYKELFAKNRD